ncbi:MAG: methyl-accepting chemotaxis protein [Candidatus Hydrogenedentes bacterium]|nr:methyl-accepting chemotaxis protein [Candidatus Hydrogenedentota bacterium]
MLHKMKLGTRITLGFSMLVLIAIALGGMAVWNMTSVRGDADKLSKESMPQVGIATDLERFASETMYAMRGYALSEDEKFWADGEKNLAEVKNHIAEAQALGKSSETLAALNAAADNIEQNVSRYNDLASQTHTTVQAMNTDRAALNEAAAKYIETCNAFVSSQYKRMQGEILGEKDTAAVQPEQSAESKVSPVDAAPCPEGDATLGLLKEGNARYVAGKSTHPDSGQARRSDTAANGQHPIATFVSCSDSRVPIELLFDQGIGNLFVVRVAGNVCDLSELASVEYGIEHLKTPLLVVMGHSKCGAVTAAATNAQVDGNVAELVDLIKPAVDAAKKSNASLSSDALIDAAIRTNVNQSIAALLTQSGPVQEAAKAGKIKVVGAVYHIEDGATEWLGAHPEEAKLLGTPINAYHKTMVARPAGEMAPADKLIERLQKITYANEVIDLGNATRIAVWKAQGMRDMKLAEEALGNFEKIDSTLENLRKITYIEANLKEIDETKAVADQYKTALTSLLANWKKLDEISVERGKAGEQVLALAKEVAESGVKTATERTAGAASALNTASTTMMVGLAVAVLIAVVLAVTITRGITGPINRIITALNSNADQVGAAAGQVSQSSQGMAAGVSEQASSLEETSASLEQLTSMTKQNAENATQAKNLANVANSCADKGVVAMKKMSSAIDEIKKSSDETAKIIKTIDEIAFQTNLLALNAAVEAARAGDAGKGFAVVAEEVRNLAQRSAEAAKSTSSMIEGSVQSSESGVQISREVEESLGEIAQAAARVNNLVGEIAAASNEQARGIEQITGAVSQMDQVTQKNAAESEESAAAAEELTAQANEMQRMVTELVIMVRGANGTSGNGSPASTLERRKHKALPQAKAAAGRAAGRSLAGPEKVIPLDESDMNDF